MAQVAKEVGNATRSLNDVKVSDATRKIGSAFRGMANEIKLASDKVAGLILRSCVR